MLLSLGTARAQVRDSVQHWNILEKLHRRLQHLQSLEGFLGQRCIHPNDLKAQAGGSGRTYGCTAVSKRAPRRQPVLSVNKTRVTAAVCGGADARHRLYYGGAQHSPQVNLRRARGPVYVVGVITLSSQAPMHTARTVAQTACLRCRSILEVQVKQLQQSL